MNGINYILSVIRDYIPIELLNYAAVFNIPTEFQASISVDEMLTEEIIRKRLMRDLNVYSGKEVTIDLRGVDIQLDDYNKGIIHIPYEKTMGRKITNPIGIGTAMSFFANGMLGGAAGLSMQGGSINAVPWGSPCADTTFGTSQANRIYEGHKAANIDYNATLTLIGPNTIMITGLQFYSGMHLVLVCELEQDANLNGFPRETYEKLAEAAVLITKGYIYNNINIAVNQGFLQGGRELGTFKDTLDSYSDSLEDYKTYRQEVLGKAMFTADKTKMSKLIKLSMTTNF